jgi:hypothetical protein
MQKKILESNIIGKRPVGKPRDMLVNAMDTHSKETLKIDIWKRESLRQF